LFSSWFVILHQQAECWLWAVVFEPFAALPIHSLFQNPVNPRILPLGWLNKWIYLLQSGARSRLALACFGTSGVRGKDWDLD
jgi:hypothetical protein